MKDLPEVVCVQVVRRSGEIERLTLTGPLTITPGERMTHISTATGMDHFFNADGTYDGWGMKLQAPIASDVLDPLGFAAAIDAEREIIP